MPDPRTPKHEEARNSLPDELKPIFDEFVDDYKYCASLRHDTPHVSYIVPADMARAGWRRSEYGNTDKNPDNSGKGRVLRV